MSATLLGKERLDIEISRRVRKLPLRRTFLVMSVQVDIFLLSNYLLDPLKQAHLPAVTRSQMPSPKG